MIVIRAGTKRARPATDTKQNLCMEDALGSDVHMEDDDEDDGDNNQCGSPAPDESEDEHARRKRSMRVRADLHFLEKLPTLRAYQRGRFGRRGGVDGGAPQDDTSLWMRALERSLEETSFVTGEAPARAALVAPLTGVPSASRGYGVAPMRVAPAVPVTPASTPVHRVSPGALPPHGLRAGMSISNANAMRYAGYVAVAPAGSARRPTAVAVMAGGGKDDEARAADR